MRIRYGISLITLLMMFGGEAMSFPTDNRPTYQKEYDAYMQDLDVIEQTGKAPENPELDADLAKMDSNDRIRLTVARFSSIPLRFAQVQSQPSGPLNVVEILSKVEVIRVPDEFRGMYEDIYLQQLEELGRPLTPEEQEIYNRLKGIGVAEGAGHENPFKEALQQEVVVKETPKVVNPSSSGNSMANAYFSSNRAFVSAPTGNNQNSRSTSFVRNNAAPSSTSRTTVHSVGKKASSSLPSLRRGMFID